MTAPRELRRRIARHNCHAVAGSLLSAAGAAVSWLLAYGVLGGITLGLATIINGQAVIEGEKLVRLPVWFIAACGTAALILLVWEALDERRRRFRPVDDRPIVGLHIFKEILLTPARLTYGVVGHLGAIIRLRHGDLEGCTALLTLVLRERKVMESHLGAEFPDLACLHRCITTLQLIGWLDRHSSEEGPFYVVPSDEGPGVQEMLVQTGWLGDS